MKRFTYTPQIKAYIKISGLDNPNSGKVIDVSDDISDDLISMEFTGNLDDIPDGTTYARVLKTDITAGHILLSECSVDLDDIANGLLHNSVEVNPDVFRKVDPVNVMGQRYLDPVVARHSVGE